MQVSRQTRYDLEIVNNSDRNNAIAQFVLEGDQLSKLSPGIIFVRRKAHAKKLAETLAARLSLVVPAVTSDTPKTERKKLAERLRERDPDVPVVVACLVWATGIDIPPLAWVLWAGAGQAPIALKQAFGRGTRLAEGKDGFLFIDWADCGRCSDNHQEQAHLRQGHYSESNIGQVAASAKDRNRDRETADADLLRRLFDGETEDRLEPEAELQAQEMQPMPPTMEQRFQTGCEMLGYGLGLFVAVLYILGLLANV